MPIQKLLTAGTKVIKKRQIKNTKRIDCKVTVLCFCNILFIVNLIGYTVDSVYWHQYCILLQGVSLAASWSSAIANLTVTSLLNKESGHLLQCFQEWDLNLNLWTFWKAFSLRAKFQLVRFALV